MLLSKCERLKGLRTSRYSTHMMRETENPLKYFLKFLIILQKVIKKIIGRKYKILKIPAFNLGIKMQKILRS